MPILIVFFLSLMLNIAHGKVEHPYTIAKRQGLVIYQTNPYTFYCHIPFDGRGKIQVSDGSYLTNHSSRIQWEHLVPVRRFARDMICWQQAICINKKGHPFKGRTCCHSNSAQFQEMEADLHNLVPVLPKINQMRSYFEFQEHVTGSQPLPQCALQVDQKNHLVAPPPETRGFIARAYLYMHKTYHVPLTKTELHQYHLWDRENPPNEWERHRHQKIFEQQGTTNSFITKHNPF